MMHHQIKKQSAIAIAFSFLSGCSVIAMGPLKADVDKSSAEAVVQQQSLQRGEKLAQASIVPIVQKNSGMYLPVRKLPTKKSDRGDNDPALTRQIAVNRTFQSPQEFSERVTGLTGLLVNVQPDVLAVPASTSASNVAPQTPAINNQGLLPLPSVPALSSMNGMPGMTNFPATQPATPSASGFPLNLSYSGSVAGLLDVACSRMGVSWEMRDGQIKIYRYMSKTFRLSALPGDTSMNASIGNSMSTSGSSSGGSSTASTQSGSSAQTSGVNFASLSVWKGIEESIKSMLTAGVGKVNVAPALGTVTVTDAPTVVAEVERFIEKQNASLSQQVVVNVRVLSVTLDRSDEYGINWDSIFNAMSKNVGLLYKTAFAPIAGAGALTASVLNTAGSTGSNISQWRGTQAIVEALATQGKVSSLTSASVTTINNQPAPLLVGRQTSYIASSQTTISTGVATTSMTPGTVYSGFSMTIVPHIISDEKMLLQYAIDMSSLINLATIASGGSVIQTPDIDSRTSIQRMLIKSGDTIVVTGFENNDVSVKGKGVFEAENPILGGTTKGTRAKSTIVILIQPVLLADN